MSAGGGEAGDGVSVAAAYTSAAFEIVRRDALVYFSYRGRLLSQVLSGFFTLALFYYISRLVTVESFGSPDAYFAFVAVGLVILRLLASTFTAASMGVRQELVAGTFERTVVSPFGPMGGVTSLLIFPFVLALVMGVVTLTLAALVFGVRLEWATLPLALPVGLLAGLAFAPFAVVVAAMALLFKQTVAVSGFLLTGLSIVAGFYFPVSLLPGWISWMSEVQPFTPAVELLRHLVVGTPLQDPAWLDLAMLAGFAAAMLPLSFWVLQKAIQAGRRRATIIEY
jgi:ABC-2 type transport system permease protein